MENNDNYNQPTSIVFLLGEAGSGKDSIGKILVEEHGYTRVSFADAVKDEVAKLHDMDVKLLHEQGPVKEKMRSAMIELAENERAKDPLHWLKLAFLKHQDEEFNFKPGLKLVITDCRRDSEIDWLYALKQEIYVANTQSQGRAQHYVFPYLFLVKRDNKPIDTDVLTHGCISYAMGIQKVLHEKTLMTHNDIRLLDGFVHNNGTIDNLKSKIQAVVENFNLNHIYKEIE